MMLDDAAFVGCFKIFSFISILNFQPQSPWRLTIIKNVLNTIKLHYYSRNRNTTRLEQKHTKWLFRFWWRETPWKKKKFVFCFVNTSRGAFSFLLFHYMILETRRGLMETITRRWQQDGIGEFFFHYLKFKPPTFLSRFSFSIKLQ